MCFETELLEIFPKDLVNYILMPYIRPSIDYWKEKMTEVIDYCEDTFPHWCNSCLTNKIVRSGHSEICTDCKYMYIDLSERELLNIILTTKKYHINFEYIKKANLNKSNMYNRYELIGYIWQWDLLPRWYKRPIKNPYHKMDQILYKF